MKAEIRLTYFQAIETLFELVFALCPKEGVIDNEHIWYHLSTSNWQKHFDRLPEIAKGDLKLLDETVVAGPNLEMPLIQYIFFFAVERSVPTDVVNTSIEVVKKALVLLASELSDRGEYNAIKHSIRLFPLLKSWQIGVSDEPAARINIDLSNTMTYLREEKDGTLMHITKPFDTERDFQMTCLVARLISNIIRPRKAFFLHEDVTFYTFGEDYLEAASKPNVDLKHLTISVKPVYDSDDTNSVTHGTDK